MEALGNLLFDTGKFSKFHHNIYFETSKARLKMPDERT